MYLFICPVTRLFYSSQSGGYFREIESLYTVVVHLYIHMRSPHRVRGLKQTELRRGPEVPDGHGSRSPASRVTRRPRRRPIGGARAPPGPPPAPSARARAVTCCGAGVRLLAGPAQPPCGTESGVIRPRRGQRRGGGGGGGSFVRVRTRPARVRAGRAAGDLSSGSESRR